MQMMRFDLMAILGHELFPLLQLGSLRAVGGTCTALRAAVAGVTPEAWLRVARCVLGYVEPRSICYSYDSS